MARILVTGADATIAEQRLLTALRRRMRQDGHDAVQFGDHDESPAQAIKECDALVAVLDHLPADGAAAVAYAESSDKPALGLATQGRPVPALLAELCHVVTARDESGWLAALPDFYDEIRPFAGRVVRDRIPELVKAAGHDVAFRQLGDDERPRFLKQKVANEARELVKADMGQEKEEVADVLEAMEAFIRARGFDREDLRRVKEAKRKRRGGFERCFVVEATNPQEAPETSAEEPGDAAQAPPPSDEGATPPDTNDVVPGDEVDFEYGDEPPAQTEPVEDLRPGRDVKAEFFEL